MLMAALYQRSGAQHFQEAEVLLNAVPDHTLK
jgi:hypothetical protein